MAVKAATPYTSSDEDESGAIYAIPRPSTSSDVTDGPPDADSVKTLDSSPEHTHVTTPTKDRKSPPHQQNGHAQSVKKIPLIPRKVITKSGSDSGDSFKSKHNCYSVDTPITRILVHAPHNTSSQLYVYTYK